MESYKKIALLVTLVLVVISGAANAQGFCNMSYAGLMACEPSAKPPQPPPPSAACCAALAHADIPCLCSYRNSKTLPELGIDPALAMQLPAKCKMPPAKC